MTNGTIRAAVLSFCFVLSFCWHSRICSQGMLRVMLGPGLLLSYLHLFIHYYLRSGALGTLPPQDPGPQTAPNLHHCPVLYTIRTQNQARTQIHTDTPCLLGKYERKMNCVRGVNGGKGLLKPLLRAIPPRTATYM